MIQQREIKFRVFDGNKMIYLNNTGYRMKTLFFTAQPWNDTGSCSEGYNISAEDNIMQYTGLKDKNGVEIYEGDILTVMQTDLSEAVKFIVTFHNGQFCLKLNNELFALIGVNDNWSLDKKHFEIIGNIFQNPELIKK